MTTSLWVEPYVIYKHYFKENVSDYFLKLIKYTLSIIVVYLIIFKIISWITITGIVGLILKAIVTFGISLVLLTVFFIYSKEFKHTKVLIKNIIKK